jgi:nitric oxide dioxygenase
MLSDRSRPIIEATLPLVGAHIQEITSRFYPHMFEAHPELLDGMFNRGNQVAGEQQQALAGSVAAFATELVKKPEHQPANLLSRVAHKHASLGVLPEQYDVVHDNLMWAIVDVLGDAVTPEVAAAWDEVYWLMAYALINQERGLYSARGVRPERVYRDWEVAEKIQETPDVVTFRCRRVDDRLVKTSLPGQYVTVLMTTPDGKRQPRQYSLTRADDGEHRHFSVKRVRGADGRPDGEVSNLLHDRVGVGDVITMSLPYGDVVLDDSGAPVVFCSAGIGISPMAGMLSHLVQAGSHLQIMVLHADADEASVPLRRQVLDDVAALLVRARRRGRVHRPDELRRRHPARRRRLLPLRAAAVHAGGAQRAHRPGRAPEGDPVRGVRPGPVAGGPGLRRPPRAAPPWCRPRPVVRR